MPGVAVAAYALGGGERGREAFGPHPGLGRLGLQEPAPVGRQGGGGGAEAHDGGDVLHASAPGPLLLAAHHEGGQAQAPADHQRAHALGPAQLVRAYGEEVGPQRTVVDDHVTGGRGGVDVAEHAVLSGPGDQLARGLDGAHLVVAPLAMEQGQVGGIELDDGLGPNPTAAVHGRLDHGCVASGRIAHRGVLDGGADDAGTGAVLRRAPDSGVDGLRRAAGEHDLPGASPQQRPHLLSSLLDGGARHATLGVDPTGIGRALPRQPGEHGLHDLGAGGRGGGVVEVVAAHPGRGVTPR